MPNDGCIDDEGKNNVNDQTGKTKVVRRRQMSKTNNGANLGFENQLWAAAEIEDDGIPFEVKMVELSAILYEQFAEDDQLEAAIRKNQNGLGYGVRS